MLNSVLDYNKLGTISDVPTNPDFTISATVTGDRIGGTFRLIDSGTADEGVIVTDSLGRLWERIFEDSVNPNWWGALGDGITDDHQAFQEAISFASLNGRNVYVSPGKYVIGREILIERRAIRIIGERTEVTERGVSLIFKSGEEGMSMFKFQWNQNNDHGLFNFSSIENVNCGTMLADDLTTFPLNQHCFTFDKGRFNNLHIKNVSFNKFSGYCIRFGDMAYSHNMTFEDLKVLDCGGLFQTTKNVVANKADLNATDVTMRNIQVDLRGPSSMLQDMVMDLRYFRKVNCQSLIVQGVNANPSLVIVGTHKLKSVRFQNVWSEITTEAPRCYFQIGIPPNGTPDLGVFTIQDFTINQKGNFIPVELNSNCILKIINVDNYLLRNDADLVLKNNTSAKVFIDGVSSQGPVRAAMNQFPFTTIKNGARVNSSKHFSFLNSYEDCPLYEYYGEGPIRNINSKYISISHDNVDSQSFSYTDKDQFVIDPDEGRVTHFLGKGNRFPRVIINVADLPQEMIGGQMIVSFRYKIETTADKGSAFVFLNTQNINKDILYDRDHLNEWTNGFYVLGDIKPNMTIRSQHSETFNAPVSIKFSALKITYGKNLPYLMSKTSSNQPVTFFADEIPTDGDWILGDKVFFNTEISLDSTRRIGAVRNSDTNNTWNHFGVIATTTQQSNVALIPNPTTPSELKVNELINVLLAQGVTTIL